MKINTKTADGFNGSLPFFLFGMIILIFNVGFLLFSDMSTVITYVAGIQVVLGSILIIINGPNALKKFSKMFKND